MVGVGVLVGVVHISSFHEWHATSSQKEIWGAFDENIYEFALLPTNSWGPDEIVLFQVCAWQREDGKGTGNA